MWTAPSAWFSPWALLCTVFIPFTGLCVSSLRISVSFRLSVSACGSLSLCHSLCLCPLCISQSFFVCVFLSVFLCLSVLWLFASLCASAFLSACFHLFVSLFVSISASLALCLGVSLLFPSGESLPFCENMLPSNAPGPASAPRAPDPSGPAPLRAGGRGRSLCGPAPPSPPPDVPSSSAPPRPLRRRPDRLRAPSRSPARQPTSPPPPWRPGPRLNGATRTVGVPYLSPPCPLSRGANPGVHGAQLLSSRPQAGGGGGEERGPRDPRPPHPAAQSPGTRRKCLRGRRWPRATIGTRTR